jgi:O-antigen/teichoic acid export membrane protein
MSLAYAQVAGGAIGAVAMMVVGREYVQFRFGLKGWRRIAGFGSQMIAVAGVTEVARRGSDILIARMLGLADLGVFNRASNLNNLVWDKIHAIIGRVMFVDFAQHKRQGLSLRTRYLATVEIVTALLWPAFIGLAILAGPFILAVYGAKWTPAAAPLALLAVASAVLVSITMTWEVFVASGELRTQTRIEFIRAGLGFAAVAAGCTISLTAAAAARVLEAVIAVLIYRPHLERMTETRLADFLPIYGRSGVLTAVAVAPAAAVMIAHGGSPNAPLGLALGSVVLGLALWAIALVLLRHPIMVEIAQVARRLRPTARDKRP